MTLVNVLFWGIPGIICLIGSILLIRAMVIEDLFYHKCVTIKTILLSILAIAVTATPVVNFIATAVVAVGIVSENWYRFEQFIDRPICDWFFWRKKE